MGDAGGSSRQAPFEMVALCDAHDLARIFGRHVREQAPWVTLLRPDEVAAPERIDFALGYRPKGATVKRFPNLKLICSVAAGVEAFLEIPDLPPGIAVSRLCDEEQAAMMAGFACWQVVWRHRGMGRYLEQRQAGLWKQFNKSPPSRCKVGVLGFGLMGRAIAEALAGLGYPVSALVRNRPETPPERVRLHSGADGLAEIAASSDILINVLPLTAETRGLLSAPLFAAMKPGAYLINLGRGPHLVEADLIAALDSGQLSGAALDVFEVEPLPAASPLWGRPEVLITPHVASECDDAKVVSFALAEIERFRSGEPLVGLVDRAKGY